MGVTEQLLAGCATSQRWGHDGPARPECFRYAGSIGPLTIQAKLRDDFQRLGEVLAAEFELVGLFGVDCILFGGEPWPVEVNPRYTASMEVIECATGVPLVAWHVEACGQGRLPATPSGAVSQVWGKAILTARRNLVIRARLADRLASVPAAGLFPLLADIPAVGGAHFRPAADLDGLRLGRKSPGGRQRLAITA